MLCASGRGRVRAPAATRGSPGVALLCHCFPVVRWEAPVLAVGIKEVWRAASALVHAEQVGLTKADVTHNHTGKTLSTI